MEILRTHEYGISLVRGGHLTSILYMHNINAPQTKDIKKFRQANLRDDFLVTSHSAVFKFGGLLCLLDINLTKQDKPIS